MVEHAGAGCVLSLLIVAIFAVLLYEKDSKPAPPKVATVAERVAPAEPSPPPSSRPDLPTGPSLAATVIETAVILPTTEVVASPPRPMPTPPPKPPREGRVATRPREAEPRAKLVRARVEPVSPIVVPVSRKQSPHPPRSSFTEVNGGERLVDVAERVYGTPEAVDALLRANRDQVADREEALVAGSWLRTP